MLEGEGSLGGARTAAVGRTRVADLRRALAVTTDEPARSRLRLRLVDLLTAMGDTQAAIGELRQAAADGPPTAAVLFAMRTAALGLPPGERDALAADIKARRPPGAAPLLSPPKLATGVVGAVAPHRSVNREPSSPLAVPSVPMPAPLVQPVAEPASPSDAIEQAFAALAQHKPIRARRLGEEAGRSAGADPLAAARLNQLVEALEKSGAHRQSLLLSRTLVERTAESGKSAAGHDAALTALMDRATRMKQADLAARWKGDLRVAPASPGSGTSSTAADDKGKRVGAGLPKQSRAAGQGTASSEIDGGGGPGNLGVPPLAALFSLLKDQLAAAAAGGAGVRSAAPAPSERQGNGASRAEAFRRAFEEQRRPHARVRLALRWAEALKADGDSRRAAAALGRAIEELPLELSSPLRRVRATLLREGGHRAELERVLEADAQVARGEERVALRTEQADLLDRLGDLDRALEVRVAVLTEVPGNLPVLRPARQRLEGAGRLEYSLELALSAIPHVRDRNERAGLFRDVAALSETTAGDPAAAARAWSEVLALFPTDVAAFEAAERLLRQTGDHGRLGSLLAWAAAREGEPHARSLALWRLAEFRRADRQQPMLALPLYREILDLRRESGGIAAGNGVASQFKFKDEDWQRRDDLLAVHTARALAAPTAEEAARAVADRAELLMAAAAGRLDEAESDLARALELAPATAEVIEAVERLHERRGDLPGLRQRLTALVEKVPSGSTGQLWQGIGRTSEALGDVDAARVAYQRAMSANPVLRAPLSALRRLASAQSNWPEVARLLEMEIAMDAPAAERAVLLTELGVVAFTHLDGAARAVEALDAALLLEPANSTALDTMFAAALAVGFWEKAAQALEALLAAGLALADTSQRYYRLGVAAENAGQVDRALGLYSRSYARNPIFRPTLERLSEICFERQQWENAWKATEHLIERHGADLDVETRAELALRSALADLHVAQRLVAANRIAAMLNGPASQAGLRDVAESWASMRFERRLLAGVDGDRKARVLSRLAEVLALTSKTPGHPAGALARETLAALAVVDRRWADALSMLDGLGAETSLEARRRCLHLVAAGDILLHQHGDVAAAALQYQRARALNPAEQRLARPGVIQMGQGDPGGTEDWRSRRGPS